MLLIHFLRVGRHTQDILVAQAILTLLQRDSQTIRNPLRIPQRIHRDSDLEEKILQDSVQILRYRETTYHRHRMTKDPTGGY